MNTEQLYLLYAQRIAFAYTARLDALDAAKAAMVGINIDGTHALVDRALVAAFVASREGR
jgi:hypothetical protein